MRLSKSKKLLLQRKQQLNDLLPKILEWNSYYNDFDPPFEEFPINPIINFNIVEGIDTKENRIKYEKDTLYIGRNHTIFTNEGEKKIFLKYNYLQFLISKLQTKLLDKPHLKTAQKAKRLIDQAIETKNSIFTKNIRLLSSIANKYPNPESVFSDCCVATMRVIEKFDLKRGFKFSTYLQTSVLNYIYRSNYDQYRKGYKLLQYPTDTTESSIPSEKYDSKRWQNIERLYDAIETLSDRESFVLISHKFQNPPLKLREIGDALLISKERVRQIENDALKKLKIKLYNDPHLVESYSTKCIDEA